MMFSSEDDLLLLACIALLLKEKNIKHKKKRLWMKNLYKERNRNTHQNLLVELKVNNKDDCCNFLRMDTETFDELLSMIKPMIEKKNTVMRAAIPPTMRLSTTLRYLATGEKFEELQFISAISPRSIGSIVMETCEAIISSLANYIKVPQSEEGWKAIGDDFNEQWNFPNCIGAIGGKHIAIKKPQEFASRYYTYKKFFSLVLMATVNANYEFIFVEVGTNGHISDDGVIENTDFEKALYEKSLFIPKPSQLPGSNKVLPYVFVADDAFQMKENILLPYSGGNPSNEELIFNNRLCRARRIVENVFGILVSRFGVLQTTISFAPEKAQTIVLACCYLHNFLRNKESYAFCDMVDQESTILGDITEGTWRKSVTINDLESTKSKNCTKKAKDIRNGFMEYFNKEGAVS